MAYDPWAVVSEEPEAQAAPAADPWAIVGEEEATPPPDLSALGPVGRVSAPLPPFLRPNLFEQPEPLAGAALLQDVPPPEPLHEFTEGDLAAVFGPRVGAPLGPPLSDPGPRTRQYPEIVVSATREKPDPRPPATWGDTFSAMPGNVGGRYEMKWIGAQEIVAAHDAKKKYWQALVLPDAYRRAMQAQTLAKAQGTEIPGDLWTNDPFVQEAAAHAGVRVDQFADAFLVQDLLKMSPQELQAYAEENRAQIAPQDARLRQLASERQDVAEELRRNRPNFGSDWSGKALTFDIGTSLAADMAPSLAAGFLLGPEAGLGTLGALTFPEQYADLKNQGLNDTEALFGALAYTATEVIPEMGAIDVLLGTPAGKQALRKLIGSAADGRLARTLGGAGVEATSEMVTEALQIGLDKGILDQHTPLSEALERLAHAGVLGAGMGGPSALIGTIVNPPQIPLPEPKFDEAAFDAGLQGPTDALPPPGTVDFADVFASANPQGFAAPSLPKQSDVQQNLPFNRIPAPYISSFPEVANNTFPPQGTMPAPALTGSRAPEPAGGTGTAPIPPATQGTATPPGEPPPLSSALQQPEPAAAPAPPAPQEPAPAPAPQAAPAVSPAPEPPASAAASPIVRAPDVRIAASVPAAVAALKDPTKHTQVETKGGPVRLVNVRDENPDTGQGVIHAFDDKGRVVGSMFYSIKPGEQPHVTVSPERQRQGIASAMYDLAEKSGGIIPPANAEGQARLPEGQAFREGREAKKARAAAPAETPEQKKEREGREAIEDEAYTVARDQLHARMLQDRVSDAMTEYRALYDELAAKDEGFVETLDTELEAAQQRVDAAQTQVDYSNAMRGLANVAERAATSARTFLNKPAMKTPQREYRFDKSHEAAAERYAKAQRADIEREDQEEAEVPTPAAGPTPPKPLKREEVYPQPEGPVRENVGEKELGESDPGDVTEMPTTPDKFEEVINEFPALFEPPKKPVSLPLAKTWKKRGTPFLSPEEAARRIESWQRHAEKQSEIEYPNGNQDRVILSLFDLTGHWAQPYADAGYDVRTLDLQNGVDILDLSTEWFAENMPDIHNVYGILIACPCTDFTVSGNQHWAAKDADGRTERSKELVFQALRTVEFWRPAMWVLENPVGRIEELTGLPPARLAFDPWHYGDPYTKRTLLWGKFNANLPMAPVDPVEGSKMHSKYGGSSQRTKNARSATPKGFASAFFMANNYLDATPAERLLSQFPEAAGAIEQALAAGISEAQIREVVTDPYENYEYAEARDAIRQLVKGSKKSTPKAAPKPAAAEPPTEPAQPKGKATGKRETVITAAGTKIETEFEVIEAADLVTSDNPTFPQQYQPRERGSRAVSAEQIGKIAGNLDPEQLGSNRHAEHGAPIIGKDDNLVESGNGRVMAMRQMYERNPEKAKEYRDFIARESGQDVSDMKAPILVRRRVTELTPAERAKFTKEANKTAVAKMSAAEQAKLDQENLTPEVMAKLPEEMPEGFDLSKGEGAKFVAAFVSKFTPAERGELVDADGKPSATAVTRAKAALLTKAYGGTAAGDAAIRRAAESTSNDAATLVNTLVRFAAPFAQLREDIANGRVQEQADIGGKIAEAIEVVRAAGSPAAVTEWLNTEDMLDPKDDTVKQLIQTFYSFDGRGNVKRLRTGAAIGATLGEYLTLARQYRPEQAGGGLFGDEGAAPTLKPAAELGKINAARQARETAREREETEARGRQGGLFTAGGQPSAAVSPRPRDAEGGEDAQSAGLGARRDAGRSEAQEEGDQPDFLTDELRRPQRKKSKRRPGPFSMTREGEIRASHNEQIWTDAGLDPGLMELAPPPERYKRAAELVKKRFGFRAITKANNLNWGEAIDALKDAYVGLTNLAAVMNVNAEVMSLGGRLALSLEREHKGALAYYQPGTKTIGMTRRNDAFAHEWAHALDHFLIETYAPEMLEQQGRHLTGKTRSGGVAETMDDQVREAYIDVLNAMYFDAAKAALYVADLEKKVATAKTNKQRQKWQTMLDNFKMGHSKRKGIESQYYEAAKAMDAAGPEGAGDEGYWQRPTEMFARSFEAMIGNKIAGLPAGHPFVTQAKRMYDENRIGAMRVPYPQASDKTNIFSKLDTLVRALRDASYVGTGNAPARIDPTDTRFWKFLPLTPKAQARARSVKERLAEPLKRQLAEAHRADRDERERKKQDKKIRDVKLNQSGLSGRRRAMANAGLTVIEWISQLPRMIAFTLRGILLALDGRHPGNMGLRWLRANFATDPGSGRFTGAVWSEETRHWEKTYQNRFAEIVKKNDVRGFDDAELRQLRDVLVDAIPADSVPDKIKNAAVDMRKFLNDMYTYNVSNGVEIGYAKNGYLPRIVDALLVENDPDGFRAKARELYARVYSQEVGPLSKLLRNPLENPEGIQNLIQYVREIARNGEIPEAKADAANLLEEAKELEEALAELKEAADNGEDTAELEETIAGLTESIYDGLRDAWAMEAAWDWEARIRNLRRDSPSFAFEAQSIRGKYSKSRVLPPETDAIMGDYFKNDPLELITTYISQSVRRVEFGKFFGNEEKGKKLGWKLDEALHQANLPYRAADGSMQRITADEFEELQQAINLLVGRHDTIMTKKALRWRMKLTALMTPVILARSLRSQLAEPWVTATKTGSLSDGLRVFHKQMQDLGAKLGIKSLKQKTAWRREMSEYFGIVADHMADQIMLQRYNLMDLNSSDRVKMARFFQIIGVHPHAMSMRRGVAEIFMTRYAPMMAQRAMQGGKKGKLAAQALAELGLDVNRAGLLAEVAQLATIKDTAQLDSLRHIDAIRTAINRFTDTAVQNPSAVDKPALASMPEYSFMYGILSFQFAYQRNVLVATLKQIRNAYRQDWKMGAQATASAMASLSLLSATHLAAWIAGMALWDDDDWEDIEKKIGEEWAWQAMSRSGFLGAADPIVNAFLGLKYERDLSAIMAGPIPGLVLKTAQDIGRAALDDSQTNTMSHRAIKSSWNVASAYVASKALGIAGAFPGVDAALGTGLMYLTSPLVTDWVADFFVGDTDRELRDEAEEGDFDAEQELQDRQDEREMNQLEEGLDADPLEEMN